MSIITTHVLDISLGRPAKGVVVVLEFSEKGDRWVFLAKGVTDRDGRLRDLLPDGAWPAKGIYRLRFETGEYFRVNKLQGFYPAVHVIFEIRNPKEHYHVPLLLSPHGYSTYRGS